MPYELRRRHMAQFAVSRLGCFAVFWFWPRWTIVVVAVVVAVSVVDDVDNKGPLSQQYSIIIVALHRGVSIWS